MIDRSISASNTWLQGARVVPSENYDDRPSACEIELIVLHAISLPPEQFGGGYVEKFFTNSLDWKAHEYFQGLRGLRVSSHLFVNRCGAVTQFVELDKRAWHAGDSIWNGRKACNDFSIGIELEGSDSQPYEREQYLSLIELLGNMFALYPLLNVDSVVGHSDVSPGRKTDPGPFFDWNYLRTEIGNFNS